MSDAQFAILVSVITAGLSGIALAIKFVGGRIVKALDDNSSAMIKNTESNAILATKVDSIASFVRERTTPPMGLPIIMPPKG